VKLLPAAATESEDRSDYINASHVESHGIRYIVSQGPLPITLEDFWLMIWQQNVRTLVMLTALVEKEQHKCARYYPRNTEKIALFGPLAVTLLSKGKVDFGIKLRRLYLENSSSDSPGRLLLHIQMAQWPDFGLPTSGTQGFRHCIHLLEKLSAELATECAVNGDRTPFGPVLVHCSAGVGRSGTFCTVHSILRKLQQGATAGQSLPDLMQLVWDTVRQLRAQRAGMVQTKDQYAFCHKAIRDALAAATADAPRM